MKLCTQKLFPLPPLPPGGVGYFVDYSLKKTPFFHIKPTAIHKKIIFINDEQIVLFRIIKSSTPPPLHPLPAATYVLYQGSKYADKRQKKLYWPTEEIVFKWKDK